MVASHYLTEVCAYVRFCTTGIQYLFRRLRKQQMVGRLTASLLPGPHSLYYNSMLIGFSLLALYMCAFLK